ncbi:MAG: hypothetical protein K6U80_02535 [Firmicutes bacterium]|nr:hypothetical protein [Bacillota bacterium]
MKLTASELADTSHEVLTNDKYRHNCEIIGETLRNAGGYQRAADEIFAFKRQNNIR